MNKEYAEGYAKYLADSIEKTLKEFTEKNPIEKLKTIQRRFIQDKEPLSLLLNDLIEILEKYDARESKPDKWLEMDLGISVEISHFQQIYFSKFLYFSAIQAFFSSPSSPIKEKFRNRLRTKYDLTSGKFQQALFESMKSLFLEEVTHGGSKSDFDERKQLEFLALYNRYLIVIRNARKERRRLKKSGKSDMVASREALLKYQIPDKCSNSTFLSDAPSEIALDWAIETFEINYTREYSKILLNKIRKQFRGFGLLVDVDYSVGRRVYSVHPRNNERHLSQLRYTPLEKPNERFAGDPDDLMIEHSI